MIATPAGTTASLLRRWWPALLVASVAVGVFSNSFSNEFIYDDWTAIVENPTIRSWSNIWELINPTSEFHRTFRLLSYRPLQYLSYLVLYKLFGLNAGAHHLFNVALHALNTLLVFVILRRLTRDEAVALVGALAFAVHPIHMEAVQVSGLRADLLATPFFLAALLCHLRLRDRPHHSPLVWAGLAAVSYFLACTGKEIGATLPLVALFLDLRRERLPALLSRKGLRPYLGYTVAAALYGWLRFGLFSNIHQGDAYLGGSPLAALLTTGRIFVAYLDHLLLPFNIRPEYVFTPSGGLDAASVGSWALLAALAWVAWLARHRHPTVTVGLVWLGVTLLPVANLVPIRNPMADRYLYLPSIGFCAIVGWAVVEGGWAAKQRWGALAARAVALLGASVLIAWGAMTWKYNTIWRDDLTLWSETSRLEPASYKAHHNLGVALKKKGRYAEAEEELTASIRRWPRKAGSSYYTLGLVYAEQSKDEQAIELFRQALPSLPPYISAWAHYNLGILYERQGLREQAKGAYREAIRLNPTYPKALTNLGVLWGLEGHYAEAEAAFQKAAAADPTDALVHYNLGLLYERQGQPEQAKTAYQEAIRLNATYPKALTNLGALLASEGHYAEAEAAFQKAAAADPTYIRAHYKLGLLYRSQGQPEQAKAAYREAIRLNATYPKALNSLGALLASEGHYAEAEAAFQKAVAADPTDALVHYNLGFL